MPSKYLNIIGGQENTDWFLNYDNTSKTETIFLIGTYPDISFQINSLKDLTISYIVVGGGGGGGFGTVVVSGGGGGGGGVSNGTFDLSANTSFFAQVGKGGFGGNNGTGTYYTLFDGENGDSSTLSTSINTIISSVTGGGGGGSYSGTGVPSPGAPGVPGGGAGGSGSAAGSGTNGQDGLCIDGLYYGGGGGSGGGLNVYYNGGMGGGGGGGGGGIGGIGANGANGGNGASVSLTVVDIDLGGLLGTAPNPFLNISTDLSRLKGSNGLDKSGNGGNGANIGGGGGGGGEGSSASSGGNGGNGIIILYVTDSTINAGSNGGETILASCFPEKTPINCDQGIIDIDKINPKYHTIQGKKILSITKSIYELDTIVCIEKDAFYKNVPCKNTLLTNEHKLFYNGKMIEAIKLVDLNDKIYIKKNKSKFVYNVLLEKYDKMLVNNLIVDTLHPESKIAKYYAKHNYILDKEFEETMLTLARGFYKKIHTNNK